MLKAFKYEIKPNTFQKEKLEHHFGCARFVYNFGLNEKSKKYKDTKENLSCFNLGKQVTLLKKEKDTVFLKNVHSQILQSSLRNLDNAFTGFFKGKSAYPNFKKKKNRDSFQYPQGVKLKDNKVYLPKIGWVVYKNSRNIKGDIKTVTVSKTPTDKYFVSILCETNEPKPVKNNINSAVGVDLGIKVFAYCSDGKIFENQKFLIQSQKKLRIAQRSLSRKQRGSIRRSKQRLVVAKIYEKITNQRKDFLHKTSTELVRNFDAICIEDLAISNMVKNHKLAKAISDVSWAEFRTMLTYKCEWYGKTLNVINRFEPSSKMCHKCGYIDSTLKLSDREYNCKNCTNKIDRDANASINIRDLGLGLKPSAVKVRH